MWYQNPNSSRILTEFNAKGEEKYVFFLEIININLTRGFEQIIVLQYYDLQYHLETNAVKDLSSVFEDADDKYVIEYGMGLLVPVVQKLMKHSR